MKKKLTKIVTSCFTLLAISISAYSQNKEAFEIYYLPDTLTCYECGLNYDGSYYDFLDRFTPYSFWEHNNKVYFQLGKAGVIVLDLLTKETEHISKIIDEADTILMVHALLANSYRFPDLILRAPYSNSVYVFDDSGSIMVLDAEAPYPKLLYSPKPYYNKNNTKVGPFAFPPKELESEYAASEGIIVSGEYYQTDSSLANSAGIIYNPLDNSSTLMYVPSKYHYNNLKNGFGNDYHTINIFALIDTFKLLSAGIHSLMKVDLKTKEYTDFYSVENDYRPFSLFPNKVSKLSDLKTHLLKRHFTDYNNIFHFIYENNELTRMSDIDISNSFLFSKYKNTVFNGKDGAEIRIKDLFVSNTFHWANDEVIFTCYLDNIAIYQNATNYQADDIPILLDMIEEVRRTFTILDLNTGANRTFTIPKELFTRDDFFYDGYSLNAGTSGNVSGGGLIRDLSDGRKGFLIRQYGKYDANYAHGYIFVIYDPSKDTTGGSIVEKVESISVQVVPNPTSSVCTLTLDLAVAGNLRISLDNLLGQELIELHNGFQDAGALEREFSISSLPAGVYYVKIEHNGNIKTEKFVKK